MLFNPLYEGWGLREMYEGGMGRVVRRELPFLARKLQREAAEQQRQTFMCPRTSSNF